MDSFPARRLPACLPEEFAGVALSEKHLKCIIDKENMVPVTSKYSVMCGYLHLKCLMSTLQKMPEEHIRII